MHSNKTNVNKIFLSLLALLMLVSVAIGVTYSWIEGGVTYTIAGNVNTLASKTTTYGRVNTTSLSAGKELDLTKFDYVTNKDLFHFTPVSGNGENFFFNIGTDSQGNALYRQADTNDVGTKFIKYNFDFKAEKKSYLYFTSAPVITLYRNDVEDNSIDTSAFRFMIKLNNTKHVLSTSANEQTVSAVSNINGSTENVTVKPISMYTDGVTGATELFTLTKNQEDNIEVAIWLDSSVSAETLAQLSGCKVDLNLNLKIVGEKITVKVDTQVSPSGASKPTNVVTIGGSGTSYTGYEGDKVQIKAVDKTGYTFDAWYYSNGDKLTTDKTYTITIGETGTTYYAKYLKNYTISLTARLGEDDSTAGVDTAGGYVSFTENDISSLSVSNDYPYGESVTLYAKAKSGYKLTRIVDEDGNTYSSGQTISNISESKTFYAEFEELETKVIYFKPSSDWKSANAWFAGWVWGGSVPDQWIIFEATEVDGIYSANIPELCTGIKLVRMNPANTVPDFNTGAWNQSGDITINTSGKNLIKLTNGSNWNETTITWHNFPVTVNVTVNNSNYGTAKIDSKTSIVTYSGHIATLTASPASSSYEFVGWYDADGNKVSGTNTSDSQTLEISGDINETITYTAKFQKKTATTRTIYFDANHWDVSGATFAAYVWNSSGEKTIWMSEIDNTGVFSCEIDKAYTNIIFIRMNSSATSSSFGWDYKWNQTADLTIPSDGKNMFAPNNGNWDGANGTWSIYTG